MLGQKTMRRRSSSTIVIHAYVCSSSSSSSTSGRKGSSSNLFNDALAPYVLYSVSNWHLVWKLIPPRSRKADAIWVFRVSQFQSSHYILKAFDYLCALDAILFSDPIVPIWGTSAPGLWKHQTPPGHLLVKLTCWYAAADNTTWMNGTMKHPNANRNEKTSTNGSYQYPDQHS